MRSNLHGGVPVSQTPRKGSTLAHYLQTAQPRKLFLDNLCRMCKVCKLKQCGENFHPDGKLTENDKGPDPDPTQASSYIALFSPGTKFRPKHFTQIYPTMISNTPSSKKSPPFLWVHQSCLAEYLIANKSSHPEWGSPFSRPLHRAWKQQHKNIIRGGSTGLWFMD